VNKDFTGHGISTDLHMPPHIYHHGKFPLFIKDTKLYTSQRMEEGNVFTIEPILMATDDFEYEVWRDGWTVVAPGIPSCQWEHMVLVTDTGFEILTLRDGE